MGEDAQQADLIETCALRMCLLWFGLATLKSQVAMSGAYHMLLLAKSRKAQDRTMKSTKIQKMKTGRRKAKKYEVEVRSL